MTVATDNLEEAIKAGKVVFDSLHPIDKVVTTGTTSVSNDGATSSPQVAKIVSATIANPYGRKAYVRAKFSVDGGANYQSMHSELTYTFTYTLVPPAPPGSTTLSGLKAGLSIGVSNSLITFRTANGFHGNVTDNGTIISYTPTALSFLIKYAIFEQT